MQNLEATSKKAHETKASHFVVVASVRFSRPQPAQVDCLGASLGSLAWNIANAIVKCNSYIGFTIYRELNSEP